MQLILFVIFTIEKLNKIMLDNFKYKKQSVNALIVVVSFIVLVLILQIIAGKIISNKIEKTIFIENEKYYDVKINRARVNLFRMSVILKGLKIIPDSLLLADLGKPKMPNVAFDIDMRKLQLKGIGILEFLRNKYVGLDSFIIDDTKVSIYMAGTSDKNKSSSKSGGINLDSLSLKGISGGNINNFRLEDIVINVVDTKNRDTLFSAGYFEMLLHDITLSENKNDSSFKANWGHLKIKMTSERAILPGNTYNLSFDDLEFSTETRKITLTGLGIKPKYSLSKMVSFSKFNHEIYNVSVGDLEINSVDIYDIIRDSGIYLSSINIDKLKLDIYKDKRLPYDTSKRPKLPQQLLKSMKIDLNIDSIDISNSELIYSERHELSDKPMSVTLGSLNVKVKNVTSVLDSIINGAMMTINLNAELQNHLYMGVDIYFPLNSVSDTFSFSGHLKGGDLKLFNPVLKPVMAVSIESGTLDKLTFSASANPYWSIGKMDMQYHNLKGNVMNHEMTRSKKLLTWIANTVLIQNNPIKNNHVRIEPMYFDRDMYKGLGNYLWKTLQSGITATIIPTMKSKVEHEIKERVGSSKKRKKN